MCKENLTHHLASIYTLYHFIPCIIAEVLKPHFTICARVKPHGWIKVYTSFTHHEVSLLACLRLPQRCSHLSHTLWPAATNAPCRRLQHLTRACMAGRRAAGAVCPGRQDAVPGMPAPGHPQHHRFQGRAGGPPAARAIRWPSAVNGPTRASWRPQCAPSRRCGPNSQPWSHSPAASADEPVRC